MMYFHLRPYAPCVSHKIDMLSQTKYFSFKGKKKDSISDLEILVKI